MKFKCIECDCDITEDDANYCDACYDAAYKPEEGEE
jgi:hypothetical protein